jgi:gametolysin peptidase M11/alpha-galactosidase-like protein
MTSRCGTFVLAVTLALSEAHVLGQARAAVPQVPVQLEGELEVVYEDHAGGARLRQFLQTATERLELQFAGNPPTLLTGTRVRVRGVRQNNTLALTSDPTSVQTLALPTVNTFGEQRTIVILFNFQDNAATPYTTAAAQSVTFDATSKYYLENSYQQTWLSGDVFGWYTIAAKSTTCDTTTWANLADQAAATLGGANLAAYTRRIYGFPQTSACGWWGLGTIGGNPSRAWVNGSYALRVVGHEFGHNLGDYHSRSSQCDPTGCTTVEYGDDHDMMGGTTAHFNAFQKERLGWLNYGVSPPIQTVTQTNSYRIDAYEAPGTLPKALKILKSVDSSGKRTWYYLESRATAGYDSSLVPGVVLHTGSEASGNTSYELDLLPASTTFDSLLDVGQTFVDTALGLSVSTVSADATGALVVVSFDGSSCVANKPAVTASPAESPWLKPGTLFTYTVTVSNADSLGCAATAFNVGAAVPAGWTSALGATRLTVAPGSTGSTSLQVTSPSSAGSGWYGLGVTAASASDAAKSASASASYIIMPALAVRAWTAQPSYKRSQVAAISANVLAGSAAASGATVTFTITRPGGTTVRATATTDATGTANYGFRMKARDPIGTYQVTATATLNGATGSATTTFQVY